MEQAQFLTCTECHTANPPGHKFCGRCGALLPESTIGVEAEYFGILQEKEKANLVLIRGPEKSAANVQLRASVHELGQNAEIKIADSSISALHARFEYQQSQLLVRDQNSLNGIYRRIDGRVKLQTGDRFVIGDQFFEIQTAPEAVEEIDEQQTSFFGSPIEPSALRVTQILSGEQEGLSFCPHDTKVIFGRCGCDVNLFDDPHITLEHCSLERDADGFSLQDLDSLNGTYVKLREPTLLSHGDYLRLGDTILRVEFNA